VEVKTMKDKFTLADITALLNKVAADMKSRVEELRELDSVIGDGDLGITIELAAGALSDTLATLKPNDLGELFLKAGLNINKVSPSTFGTLLAAGFMGTAKVVKGKKEITVADFAAMGDGAIDGIKMRGKAEVGDKTMLDSLVPAVNAFKDKMKGSAFAPSMDAGVKASEGGMNATVNMTAKHGRASRHQGGTVKIRDGGATAVYYIIDSFVRHVKEL
jgi:phosphoenolpyruvate---glycerone phosphotransferase subunit DhaL